MCSRSSSIFTICQYLALKLVHLGANAVHTFLIKLYFWRHAYYDNYTHMLLLITMQTSLHKHSKSPNESFHWQVPLLVQLVDCLFSLWGHCSWTKSGGHVLGGPIRVFAIHSVPPPLWFFFLSVKEVSIPPHTHITYLSQPKAYCTVYSLSPEYRPSKKVYHFAINVNTLGNLIWRMWCGLFGVRVFVDLVIDCWESRMLTEGGHVSMLFVRVKL